MFDTHPLGNAVGKQLGGGTPSRQVPKYWNGSIPWASVKDFAVGGDLIVCTQERITEAGLFASASNLIPSGTPLVCTRMAVGRSALAMMPVAINQDVKALAPAAGTSAAYLLRLLQLVQPRAEAAAIGSTVKGIRIRDYLSIAVPMAPSQEQGRIAEVLDTLDTIIRQTEVIIEKLKQVKRGLLQDLLTRGIDANGKLRRPQSQAPHLYKESPLGWIPREWEVKRLGDFMASDITYGIVQAGPHVDGGVPYIRTGDMAGDRLVRASLLRTSRRIADGYRRSEVRAGEIVMAIRATVGKVLPVPQDLDGANLTQGTARLAPNKLTDAAFLLWAIRHQRAQESIHLEVKGTTFAEITLAALREVPLAAPIAIDEQRLIGKQAAACEERIQLEHQQRGKLVTLKSGLMADLLCGRVRVTPLLHAAAA